jgi:hypothetical protein
LQPSQELALQLLHDEPELGVNFSPDLTPKTLNSLSREPFPQPGHLTFSEPLMSFSNFFPQDLHLYS